MVLSSRQVEELESRIRSSSLDQEDTDTLLGLLAFVLWLQERLSCAKLSIKRLKKLFGFTSETRKKDKDGQGPKKPDAAEMSETSTDSAETVPNSEPTHELASKNPAEPNWDPSQNHGRYGADDYTGCEIIEVPFTDEVLKNGQCPSCAEHNTEANLTYIKPRVVVLLDAQPIISGERYQLQKARCTLCQAYFTADMPATVVERPKYSCRCSSAIAINHYIAGMPFKRLEMLQEAQGVPLSDSTQYDLMVKLYQSVIIYVVQALRICAANGDMKYYDDTPGRILEQMRLNLQAKSKKEKKGVHATALLSEYQGQRIYLFDTNTLPAGKQLKNLLSARTVDNDFITMSDASASNFPMLDEDLMASWIICLCLSHGRRRFVELLGEQDADIEFILDVISEVYGNDRYCKDNKLSPDERLLYHQKHSAPIMEAMRIWFNNLLLFKKVEPNSRLGNAIIYMLKHWEWLTQFLRVAGAPLDNNICEQAIKIVIRYRKNSLFYRTFYGASIGDAIMSVLYTAKYAGANIFDYLNTLQENEQAVQENPESWLPWNYEQTLMSLDESPPLIKTG